ncbi:MAG: hypothetical protein OEM81_07120 [Acidimicrobiia bacterium]|nr:hypothetical protein [Acidimicrobiia bacterium]
MTTTLLRGATYAKDNRLLPAGARYLFGSAEIVASEGIAGTWMAAPG